MATFYYGHAIEYDSPYLGVRCDICGNALHTLRTGQEFPQHITVDARQAGWNHKKVSSTTWKDFCPQCVEEIRKYRREKYLASLEN